MIVHRLHCLFSHWKNKKGALAATEADVDALYEERKEELLQLVAGAAHFEKERVAHKNKRKMSSQFVEEEAEGSQSGGSSESSGSGSEAEPAKTKKKSNKKKNKKPVKQRAKRRRKGKAAAGLIGERSGEGAVRGKERGKRKAGSDDSAGEEASAEGARKAKRLRSGREKLSGAHRMEEEAQKAETGRVRSRTYITKNSILLTLPVTYVRLGDTEDYNRAEDKTRVNKILEAMTGEGVLSDFQDAAGSVNIEPPVELKVSPPVVCAEPRRAVWLTKLLVAELRGGAGRGRGGCCW